MCVLTPVSKVCAWQVCLPQVLLEGWMLLVASGLATRNKRPLEPKASPLIENEEAGMRKRKRKKKKQGDHWKGSG